MTTHPSLAEGWTMTRSGFAVLTLLLVVSGCAPMMWDKPGGTREQFAQDKFECHRDSIAITGISYGDAKFFRACMEARGYELRR